MAFAGLVRAATMFAFEKSRLGSCRPGESRDPYVDGPLLARALQLTDGSLAIICPVCCRGRT
jgi:hypothetical protein